MRVIQILIFLGLSLQTLYAVAFEFQSVIDRAQKLALEPHSAQKKIPKFMRQLSFNDYQNIRFDPDKSLWSENNSNFQVMLFSPGLFYAHPVTINIIDAQGFHLLEYKKSYFTFEDPELEKRIPADLGFAGFKLTFPFNKPDIQNQFLVFAGASYFRAVGKQNAWGISGRGIAIDTGLPSGEEFPSFTEFWLERPSPTAKSMTFYGLLDGKSVAGAYKFVVTPGVKTSLQVKAVLFARDDMKLFGVAPLTSMFYYGENTSRPLGEWRSEIHDSDGLLIQNGVTSEWLWRPLINPNTLQMDFFHTENVRGFGLIQRDPHFVNYNDLAALYEKRPSAWVEPIGDWENGSVVLVQLPTPNETNDNIVAFWSSDKKVEKGAALDYAYTVYFGDSNIAGETMGKAMNTFVGDGNRVGGGSIKGAYRIIVDFSGGPLDKLSRNSAVVGAVTPLEGTDLIEQFVEYNDASNSWRLSILAQPSKELPLSLRGFLTLGDQTLTETWTYRLPQDNDIVPEAE
jgi:glucans biosynthesis protein